MVRWRAQEHSFTSGSFENPRMIEYPVSALQVSALRPYWRKLLVIDGEKLPLVRADTERTGLHDLEMYLRLYEQGVISRSTTSSRLTPKSVRTLLENLLEGDFLPHEERVKSKDTIRPFGLNVFAEESGLVSSRHSSKLSDEGEALVRYQG